MKTPLKNNCYSDTHCTTKLPVHDEKTCSETCSEHGKQTTHLQIQRKRQSEINTASLAIITRDWRNMSLDNVQSSKYAHTRHVSKSMSSKKALPKDDSNSAMVLWACWETFSSRIRPLSCCQSEVGIGRKKNVGRRWFVCRSLWKNLEIGRSSHSSTVALRAAVISWLVSKTGHVRLD